MNYLLLKLFNMSITASWIILFAALIHCFFKKAPKWLNFICWSVVALRLVLPFSFKSVLSLIPSTQTVYKISSSPRFNINSGISAIDEPANRYIKGTYFEGVSRPTGHFESILSVLAVLWLIGLAVFILYALISFLSIKRKTAPSLKAYDNVYFCDSVTSPFIFGFFRPRIYINSDINEADIEFVIAHEKAHIKRLDHIWKVLAFVLVGVYWFNPVIWLGYYLFCNDIECACDCRVIKDMDLSERKNYSRALLECSQNKKTVAYCPLAFCENSVKNRVKSVLKYKKTGLVAMVFALVMSVFVILFFATDPDNGSYKDLSQTFAVSDIVHNDGMYSYIQTVQTAPVFQIDDNMGLYQISMDNTAFYVGQLVKRQFDFDDFSQKMRFPRDEQLLEKLKNNNKNFWELKTDSDESKREYYAVLQQSDGCIYLGYGYYYALSKIGSDNSHIRWLYKLEGKGKKESVANQIATDGAVYFYEKVTPEHENPYCDKYYMMSEQQLEKVIKNLEIRNWMSDVLVDRTEYEFDGKICYQGKMIFFGFDQSVLFCDGHSTSIDDELMQILKQCKNQAFRMERYKE